MTQEQKDLLKRWVKALRSGKYKQTRDVLHDSEGFCCLGVLCDVLNEDVQGQWRWGENGQDFLVAGGASSTDLPFPIVEKYGLKTSEVTFHVTDEMRAKLPTKLAHAPSILTFIRLNDTYNLTFDEIADLIEMDPDIFLK